MLTLGTFAAGTAFAMGGEEKKKKEQGPPINASSKDEEDFIQSVNSLFQNDLWYRRLLMSCAESF